MSPDKKHQFIIGVDQIRSDFAPVIVMVQIFPSQQGIGFVGWNNVLKHFIFRE